MNVWDTLVGQQHVIDSLRAASIGKGMTHAWLFTGPPGSGRSNAAVAFAAALQCGQGGCGDCEPCRTTMAGSNIDVTVLTPERAIIQVEDVRALVHKASRMPAKHAQQVLVIEDADRLNDYGANALLKAIEEPSPRTVWVLCAPQPDDVLTTIRSRTRHVSLATPSPDQVAEFLVTRHAVAPAMAAHAARASQGHIGRAKALALDEMTRNNRREVVRLPAAVTTLGDCLQAAKNLVGIAEAEASHLSSRLGEREEADLETLYGSDRKSRSSRSAKAAARDLAEQQKQRLRRQVLDSVDRSLTEMLSVYRDLLILQTGAGGHLVNEEQRREIEELARRTTPEETLRRIDAVYQAREQMLEFNVPPLLALESMMVALKIS